MLKMLLRKTKYLKLIVTWELVLSLSQLLEKCRTGGRHFRVLG